MNWQETKAAIYDGETRSFRAIRRIDPILLDDLLYIDRQKEELVRNTDQFVQGKKANHALLWGARGCGKSSLIKAVFNHFSDQGLRVIEVDRDDLKDLPYIASTIEDEPFRFVIFCDDLSFESDEKGYKGLKRIMEGSIELPPENLLVYATSNRRHLLPEFLRENESASIGLDGEIHYQDAVEEKLSLSDRFGLVLSFYSGSQKEYLEIVLRYFEGTNYDKDTLTKEAKEYAALRANHTPRTAKQFVAHFLTKAQS